MPRDAAGAVAPGVDWDVEDAALDGCAMSWLMTFNAQLQICQVADFEGRG